MQSIFNGQTPVERQTVLPGQSKYYYYKPGQSDDIAVSDMKTVDVTTADTPNPFLNKTESENENTALSQKSKWFDRLNTWGNNFADAAEAASIGYATGATLGNFDEAMGGATAALTLNRNNYTMGRDAVRKLQNELSQRNPYIYSTAEFMGAMTTPMHFLNDTTTTNKAINAATDTLNASAGYAKI